MKCLGLSLTIVIGLIVSPTVFAQPPAQKSKTPAKTVSSKEKSAAKSEAERLRKERQNEARFLLIALASDARSFRDLPLRTRSLARIADALWDIDAEQGRTLFRKAWEAAEQATRESNERLNIRNGNVSIKADEVNAAKFSAIASNPDLRKEVLRLVAPHDRALSEEFLEKLKESQEQEEDKADKTNSSLWSLPEAAQQRLSLAQSLLLSGNVDVALQLADPVLGHVTISTLDFLTILRAKNAAAADQRYAAMLASAGNNMASDANTVSLLSSYIFTPGNYMIYNADGGASSAGRPNMPPANVSPQVRTAFFQAATAVLLRPQSGPEQDQTSAGIAGKYLIVRNLLPLFEQYAPAEATASIRGQLEALNALVSENVRRGETNPVPKELADEKSAADLEASLLKEIEHADLSEQRDRLYFDLAVLALRKDDLKARDYAGKIEESGFRKQAQAWVDWGLAVGAIRKNKTDVALELNRTGELTHIQRVWILTQAAKQLAKSDRAKAAALVDTASAEARRIDGGELDRPRGLLAIANVFRLVEPARVSEALFDAVKAANSTEGFTGEGGTIMQMMNSKGLIRINPQPVPEFDVEEVFGALATDDYERAVQLARGFQAEAPRANATIAIARSVLNEKAARVPAP